jgi:AraC family transcriptional regulator, regulatory protein of adaptative response / DNA-3-methyladenine glycosylase II
MRLHVALGARVRAGRVMHMSETGQKWRGCCARVRHMTPDRETCYQAVLSRDRRFDGWFYVAVSSTGIYCRPVCPVRVPKFENCTFYDSAAQAEHAGYRPCLRCRPELAPGHGLLDVSSRLAQAAAEMIGAGFLNDAKLDDLAARIGVTARHLRRIFEAEFGVAPLEYAQTQRLLLAKRLLTESTLPAAQVALAAGFGSVRRFNEVFGRRYGMTPARLRKQVQPAMPDTLTLELGWRPPFAWHALLAFLADHAVEGVERIERDTYTRTLAVSRDGRVHRGWLTVENAPQRHAVRVTVSASLTPVLAAVLAQVRRAFDLDCRPDLVDARLGDLARATPGLRVPGAFDGFEIAARSIAMRQWPLPQARLGLRRVAERFGMPVDGAPAGLRFAFPSAARIADGPAEELRATGLSATGATQLIRLAVDIANAHVALEPYAPVDDTLDYLRHAAGLDEWVVQNIAMRALGWPNAFPVGDPLCASTAHASDARAGAQWAPWRAYAAQHLTGTSADRMNAA